MMPKEISKINPVSDWSCMISRPVNINGFGLCKFETINNFENKKSISYIEKELNIENKKI